MSARFRLLGILPVIFFLAHFRYHLGFHTPENMFWLCNFSNVLLAAGLFFNVPMLIRVAFLWAIPGVPLWMVDMLHTGDYPVSTFLSHLGGFTVGFLGMRKVRAHPWAWVYAWIYALTMQQICRWITPPKLNVNVAFKPYYGWEQTFNEYWKWWLFIAFISALALWLMSLFTQMIFPVKHEGTKTQSKTLPVYVKQP